MRRILPLVAGCLISALCLWLIFRHIDVSLVGTALVSVGFATWGAAMLIYLLGFLPRGLRWHLMLRDLGHYPVLETSRSVILGYAANNLLPFRLGEIVRATTFAKLNGTSLVTTLSSIMAERILDAISLILIFSVTLCAAGQFAASERLRPIMTGAALLGLVGAFMIVMLAGPGRSFVERLAAPSPRLAATMRKVFAAMIFIRSFRRMSGVAFLSLTIWLWEGLVFVLIASALELPAPWLTGYFTLCIVNLGILIPSAPGYVGVFQAAAVLAAIILQHSESTGLALGILCHAAQFLPITLLGILLAWPLWQSMGGWRGLLRTPNDV